MAEVFIDKESCDKCIHHIFCIRLKKHFCVLGLGNREIEHPYKKMDCCEVK